MQAKYLKALLEQLAEKTGESLDNSGFIIMSEQIGNSAVSSRYLRENMFNRLQKGEKDINVQQNRVDVIARYLGYSSFNEFAKSIDHPIPEPLLNILGNWHSIVRSNSGNPELLVAPVRIWSENNTMKIQLKGGQRTFSGKITEKGGNAYIMLDSGENKALTIILKVGISKNPHVLQGVFSGISTNGDPICGRELFVHVKDKSFDEMKWEKVWIGGMSDHTKIDPRIVEYFSDYQKNCIKINRVSNFNLDDLIAGNKVE